MISDTVRGGALRRWDHGRIIAHPAIKNDSGAILRFFEIAIVLLRLDHVASRIVNANQSILPRARVDLRGLRSVFPWRLCHCSRPQASVLIGFAKA